MNDYFNRWIRARIGEAMTKHCIRESGQVKCPVPQAPRHDGEPCGSCRAVL